jgi:hypothetical protein
VIYVSTFVCIALLGIVGDALDVMGTNLMNEEAELLADANLMEASNTFYAKNVANAYM